MAAIPLIEAILKAVTEGSKVYHTWLKGRDKRRDEAAIDAAESYIFANEKDGLTGKKKAALLLHYRKRFFKYN